MWQQYNGLCVYLCLVYERGKLVAPHVPYRMMDSSRGVSPGIRRGTMRGCSGQRGNGGLLRGSHLVRGVRPHHQRVGARLSGPHPFPIHLPRILLLTCLCKTVVLVMRSKFVFSSAAC